MEGGNRGRGGERSGQYKLGKGTLPTCALPAFAIGHLSATHRRTGDARSSFDRESHLLVAVGSTNDKEVFQKRTKKVLFHKKKAAAPER